ncbi:50S ribosomal protein L12, apicoplast, putative [Hepatocystis sp. ex Piliocolobus tephrosceles]|nr:50S ribosomal protein L12, apicoplast, putative [Hepatocystis sp. ex Piliocolobus tephrosceles]
MNRKKNRSEIIIKRKDELQYDKKKLIVRRLFKVNKKIIFFFIVLTYVLTHLIKHSSCFKIWKNHDTSNMLIYNNGSNFPSSSSSSRNNMVISYKNRNIHKNGRINKNINFLLYSAKVDKIIEGLKELSLLEASELVKKIETTFSVDVHKQNPGSLNSSDENKKKDGDSNTDEEEEDENKVYDLILENIEPNKKIPIIKIVKEIKKDLNLKQAKDIVDNLPQTLFEKINKETADKWKTKLSEAGGMVKLK